MRHVSDDVHVSRGEEISCGGDENDVSTWGLGQAGEGENLRLPHLEDRSKSASGYGSGCEGSDVRMLHLPCRRSGGWYAMQSGHGLETGEDDPHRATARETDVEVTTCQSDRHQV